MVAAGVVAPARRDPSVVEHRLAVDRDLHEPLQAFDRAEEQVVGLDVAGRAPLAGERRVSVHGPTLSASRTTSRPLRVIHVVSRTMLASTAVRPARARPRGRPGSARSAIEQCSEDARGVEIGKAEPLDAAAARDERGDLAVGEEGEIADLRELAGDLQGGRFARLPLTAARDRARRRRLWRGGTERTEARSSSDTRRRTPREAPLPARGMALGADDVHDGVDQRQVRKRLREVPEVPARHRIDLLGVELQELPIASSFSQSLRARSTSPISTSADTSQNEQMVNVPS